MLICECCNDPIPTPAVGEPNLCRLCRKEESYITDEELAAGVAGFEAAFPILTRPGENIIERLAEERQADIDAVEDLFANDMKSRP